MSDEDGLLKLTVYPAVFASSKGATLRSNAAPRHAQVVRS